MKGVNAVTGGARFIGAHVVRRRPLLPCAWAAVMGTAAGIAIGLLLADGRITALVFGLLAAGATLGLILVLAPHAHRSEAVALGGLVFAAHAAVAVVLHAGLVATGRGGFLTGDDRGYAYIAECLVRYLTGDPDPVCVPPYWGGHAYLIGTWVYLEAAIFRVFGTDVLLAKLGNAALGTAAALLAWDAARLLFGRPSAMVAGLLVGLLPSLLVWAALNLKDTFAILLITLVLWAILRFQQRPTVWSLGLIFVALLPIESVRRYIHVELALIVPLAIMVTQRLPHRHLWLAGAVVSSALLVASAQVGFAFGPGLFVSAEGARGAMAVGARTAIDAAPTLRGITTVAAPAAATLPVTAAPQPFVAPGAQVGAKAASRPVELDPGPSRSAADDLGEASSLGSLIVVAEPGRQISPESHQESSLALRTLAYLPRGLSHALLAPAPWWLSREIDALTIPDMLIWYVILGAGAATSVRERAKWRLWLPLALFAVGLLLLLALVEGNVGTLYRHRAMVIPAVAILASPTIVSGVAWVHRRRPPRTVDRDGAT